MDLPGSESSLKVLPFLMLRFHSGRGIHSESSRKKGCSRRIQPIVKSSNKSSVLLYLAIRFRISESEFAPFFSWKASQARLKGRSVEWAKNPPPTI